jgi:hypothetical protein
MIYLNIKAMVLFQFLLPCVVFISTPKCQSNDIPNQHNIEVIDITEDLLEGYYCIYFQSKGDTSLIISKIENDIACSDSIQEGRSYKLELEELHAIHLSEGITWRLYEKDLYIDGVLKLSKELKIFSSSNVKGLCFE